MGYVLDALVEVGVDLRASLLSVFARIQIEQGRLPVGGYVRAIEHALETCEDQSMLGLATESQSLGCAVL